ncbi:MAG: hypothetical protein J7K73_00065 [Nanoarchaeota archaeon]|nr:hypothetical protein [Nanoarchaeota archaeon]
MNKKALLAFSLLFLLALTFGCIGGKKEEGSGEQGVGTLNATILVNGVKTNTLNLVSNQNAQIGIKIKNTGVNPIENVTGRILGCLEAEDAYVDEILPNNQRYMSWDVRAPEMGEGERINCPTTIRICFDYNSKGYTDLVFIPGDYNDVPPSPSRYVSSDFLDIAYNFGVDRVIPDSDENTLSGQIIIKNVGPGWVDYINYSNNLSLNTIRKINITLIGDNIEITKFGGLSKSELGDWLSDDGKSLVITSDNVGEYKYLLKLIQGKELFLKMNIEPTNPAAFQESTKIYQLRTEINHGYCIDIATLDTTLRGR